jgi:hypothetical protein
MSRRPIRKPDPTFPRRGHVARRDVWWGCCGLRWGRADHDGALRSAAREHCKRNQSENVRRDRFSPSHPHQCVLLPGSVDSEARDARLPASSRAAPAGRGEPSGVYSVHWQPCNDASVAEGWAIVNRLSPDSNPPTTPRPPPQENTIPRQWQDLWGLPQSRSKLHRTQRNHALTARKVSSTFLS